MKKKYMKIALVIALLLIVALLLFNHTLNNLTVSRREIATITANNGQKFKVIYTLHNFPDESYCVDIYTDADRYNVFGGDGSGTSDIDIEYLFTNEFDDYYKASIGQEYNYEEEWFICTKPGEIDIVSYEQVDEIINCAEELILNGENNVLEILRYFSDNQNEIQGEQYTQEEILLKSKELLDKYGDVK